MFQVLALTLAKVIQMYPKLPDKITMDLEINWSLQVKWFVSYFMLRLSWGIHTEIVMDYFCPRVIWQWEAWTQNRHQGSSKNIQGLPSKQLRVQYHKAIYMSNNAFWLWEKNSNKYPLCTRFWGLLRTSPHFFGLQGISKSLNINRSSLDIHTHCPKPELSSILLFHL